MYWAICGVDGLGKSTVMRKVGMKLLELGYDNFILTKEPGGPLALITEWSLTEDDILYDKLGYKYATGPLIRELCVSNSDLPQLAKRALYKADSFCNWETIIKPAIQSDEIVITDRCWVSDIVYGSVLGKLDAHALFQFNMSLIPQLHALTKVICLTAPSAVREARLANCVTNDLDKLGKEVRDLLANAYKRIIPEYVSDDNYWFIDTDRDLEEIVADVVDIITGEY